MSTPIVVLTQGPTASPAAEAYAALLAKTIAVPMRLLRVAPVAAAPTTPNGTQPAGHLPTDTATSSLQSETIASQKIAAALAEQDALLVVMPRPIGATPPLGWLATTVWALLQTVRPPLLLVPGGLPVQALPLNIALVADGEPFTLMHGQRTMHTLLLTLPTQITVLHAPVPLSNTSLADALQTVLACGLAARYLTTATTLAVPAPSDVAGILAGARQMGADLLVLIIRQARLAEAGFIAGPMAELLQQSPVPVLLLLAADAPGTSSVVY